jgi:hypothetical protein
MKPEKNTIAYAIKFARDVVKLGWGFLIWNLILTVAIVYLLIKDIL